MFVGWWVIFSRTCMVECLINLILKDVLFFRYENLQDVFGGYFSISWFSPFTSAPLRRANFTFHDVWQNSFKKTREGMMESLWYISLSVHFECRLLHRSKERVHVAVKANGKKSCKFIFKARWAILKLPLFVIQLQDATNIRNILFMTLCCLTTSGTKTTGSSGLWKKKN